MCTPAEHTHSFSSLTNIPETFTPAEHNHDDKYSPLTHTHTVFYNTLTVRNNRLNLYSNNKYTYLVIGKKYANSQAISFGYGDDSDGKYGYLRVLGGTQLTIFEDKATFPGEFTVTTLNGIEPSSISLNTHNHDTLYSKLGHVHSYNDLTDVPETFPPAEHNHDTLYSAINHTHSYNDLTDIPTSFNPSEHTHSYKSLTDIPTSFNPSEHNHDTLYSAINHTHSYMI